MPRTTFNSHPWSIGGGGASDLQERLDEQQQTLGDLVDPIGFASFPGLDDAFIMDAQSLRRKGVDERYVKQFVFGETVRDWAIINDQAALAPYTKSFALIALDRLSSWFRHLWQLRTSLENIVSFGGRTRKENGDDWWGWYRWIPDKYRTPMSITFAFVATHNHFVLDRGGKVFNRSAPIIKLSVEATEDEHLCLVGLLNSSTACFWMKQVFFPKGGDHVGQEGARVRRTWWDERYEFAGTQMQNFPLPESRSLKLSRQLDDLGRQYAGCLPDIVVRRGTPTSYGISQFRTEAASIRGQMVALQEELDWHCYQLYGLLSDDFRYTGDDLPELKLGERAFEIVMARQIGKGELEITWFERHGSKPITEIPSYWPEAYRKLVARRIEVIETNKEIGLIEKPEYKRRWNTETWEEQEQRALRSWLLDRLESRRYWPDPKTNVPTPQTTAQLSDKASSDHEFMEVAALYRGRGDFDLGALVAELVTSESVPFLPVLRYKPSGLRKRELWDRTWELQREQDDLAKQRVACDERLRNIRARIENSFANERAALKSMEEGFRNRCLEVRDRYAPKVTFQDDWNGATMFEKLGREGVSAAGGLALGELQATGKSVSEFQFALEDKIRKRVSEDAEYNAVRREREAIPDDPEIPVPPKYAIADFLKTDYWRLRGKLDVPKERWISYPHCSTESDPTLLVGWAGWNHLEQATAIINYYDARKREGWDAKRLTPLLAGLDQLLPWIHQWHPEIDPEFGETAGQSYQTMLGQDAHELGLTLDDIRNWQPPEKGRKTRTARKKAATTEDDS